MSAYNGAAPMIMSKEVLAAAGSIVQVEARHAAPLRFLGGMSPTTGAFDKPLPKAAVLKAVTPLIKAQRPAAPPRSAAAQLHRAATGGAGPHGHRDIEADRAGGAQDRGRAPGEPQPRRAAGPPARPCQPRAARRVRPPAARADASVEAALERARDRERGLAGDRRQPVADACCAARRRGRSPSRLTSVTSRVPSASLAWSAAPTGRAWPRSPARREPRPAGRGNRASPGNRTIPAPVR